jgi:hypothetical protein
MVTLDLLIHICPKTKVSVLEGYIEPLNTVAEYYEMIMNATLKEITHE